jgi:hypothetical protein
MLDYLKLVSSWTPKDIKYATNERTANCAVINTASSCTPSANIFARVDAEECGKKLTSMFLRLVENCHEKIT